MSGGSGDLGSLILEFVFFAPFSLPYQLLEPGLGPPCGWSFASPPFSGLASGYLEPSPCVAWAGGGAGLYAVDAFLLDRVVTTLELSGGSLGVNGWACEVRSPAGYLAGPIEVYAGWDALWLGAPRQQAQYLGGPVFGVRAYF